MSKSAMLNDRCGFPNGFTFGCPNRPENSRDVRKNNPQLNFGYDSSGGKIRLLFVFVVDLTTTSYSPNNFNGYVSSVQNFFAGPAVAPLWAAALSKIGPGSSQFLSGGPSRRALREEEETAEQASEEGAERMLPAAKANAKPVVVKAKAVKVINMGSTK